MSLCYSVCNEIFVPLGEGIGCGDRKNIKCEAMRLTVYNTSTLKHSDITNDFLDVINYLIVEPRVLGESC